MNLCDRNQIKDIMEESGIGFRKDLGQNFLTVPGIPVRCADECESNPNTLMLEIGPGIGTMTRALCDKFKYVVAVELDTRLIPVLGKTLADYSNVTVVEGDIMKTDIAALLSRIKLEQGLDEDYPVAVCANLPYYITTPILMYLVESKISFRSITVMVQSEVADRLTAPAGSENYGAITAVLSYYGECKRLFSVSAGCFVPQPKVNSAVVRFAFYEKKPVNPKSEKLLFAVIKAAFAQRRKTLLNALCSVFGDIDKEKMSQIINKAGLPEKIRGEKLDISQFAAISDLIFIER